MPDLILGFTGTRQGLTSKQALALSDLLRQLKPSQVHHGDAVGADEEFAILVGPGTHQVAHPCDVPAQRSRHTTPNVVAPVKPPLERNRDIVDACALLIACPAGMQEEQRSGTWATVRYARKVRRPHAIVWPDGLVTTDPPDLLEGGEARKEVEGD
jgi:hypothetical protein